ncbi:unnamed protein product [Rotaria sordida]|uniref:CSD domain-containing protein n=1 Tax=Rotaria sordida TaxID=392033 RepID=A0A815Z1Y8_9BILA|nr:unnamed protein product [Rotaria sordida]CAF1577754.1 unnamed protein product [Rotaria sordida]
MSSTDVATNQNQASDQKSDVNKNKQQDQANSGTDSPKQINGKPVIATKVTGKVKWFNVKSGYGFIQRDDINEDIFIHQTAIIRNNPLKYLRSVGDEEKVEFDIVQGHEEANVTGPNGAPVQGSKYAADVRSNYTRGNFRGGRDGDRPPFRSRGPFRGRGGPFRGGPGGFDSGFGQQFGNYGPPQMMGRPSRDFGGPMFRGRGRPPFRGGYDFDGNYSSRGPRIFRGPGAPMMGGPMGHMSGPMVPAFGGGFRGRSGFRGRGRGRGRFFRGARQGYRSDSYSGNNNENQTDDQDAGQSSV